MFIFSFRRTDARGDKGKAIYPRAGGSTGSLADAEARPAAVQVRTQQLFTFLADQALGAGLVGVAEALLALREGGILAGAEARRAAVHDVHVHTRLAGVLANQALGAGLGVVAEALLALLALQEGGWAHLNLRCVA